MTKNRIMSIVGIALVAIILFGSFSAAFAQSSIVVKKDGAELYTYTPSQEGVKKTTLSANASADVVYSANIAGVKLSVADPKNAVVLNEREFTEKAAGRYELLVSADVLLKDNVVTITAPPATAVLVKKDGAEEFTYDPMNIGTKVDKLGDDAKADVVYSANASGVKLAVTDKSGGIVLSERELTEKAAGRYELLVSADVLLKDHMVLITVPTTNTAPSSATQTSQGSTNATPQAPKADVTKNALCVQSDTWLSIYDAQGTEVARVAPGTELEYVGEWGTNGQYAVNFNGGVKFLSMNYKLTPGPCGHVESYSGIPSTPAPATPVPAATQQPAAFVPNQVPSVGASDNLDSMPQLTVNTAPLGVWFHPVHDANLHTSTKGQHGQWSWANTLQLITGNGGTFEGRGPGMFVYRMNQQTGQVAFAIRTTSKWKSQFMSGNYPFSVNVKTMPGAIVTVTKNNGGSVSQATSDGGDITIMMPDDGVTTVSFAVTDSGTHESFIWVGPYDRSDGINTVDAR